MNDNKPENTSEDVERIAGIFEYINEKWPHKISFHVMAEWHLSEIAQLRSQLEQANKDERTATTLVINLLAVNLGKEKDLTNKLQSEAAVMREALLFTRKYCHGSIRGNPVQIEMMGKLCDKALSTTAGKELLEKYQALEKRGDEQCARAIASEQEAEHQHCMLETLQLDYSNLVSANKVMSEKLTDQIQIYVGRMEKMEKALTIIKDMNASSLDLSIIASKALKP